VNLLVLCLATSVAVQTSEGDNFFAVKVSYWIPVS
jgi:hypothetical protein